MRRAIKPIESVSIVFLLFSHDPAARLTAPSLPLPRKIAQRELKTPGADFSGRASLDYSELLRQLKRHAPRLLVLPNTSNEEVTQNIKAACTKNAVDWVELDITSEGKTSRWNPPQQTRVSGMDGGSDSLQDLQIGQKARSRGEALPYNRDCHGKFPNFKGVLGEVVKRKAG
jgi:hypothetical protein